ncbi:unnamed protein product [Nezara viridula]|uniref:Uncharacterized protein n=1 Tax=Nezara viridula TaxID=85310 RepID=A0A9P0H6D8_NEZVI|nr:unnamed protein product [Nezara viridula]
MLIIKSQFAIAWNRQLAFAAATLSSQPAIWLKVEVGDMNSGRKMGRRSTCYRAVRERLASPKDLVTLLSLNDHPLPCTTHLDCTARNKMILIPTGRRNEKKKKKNQ